MVGLGVDAARPSVSSPDLDHHLVTWPVPFFRHRTDFISSLMWNVNGNLEGRPLADFGGRCHGVRAVFDFDHPRTGSLAHSR